MDFCLDIDPQAEFTHPRERGCQFIGALVGGLGAVGSLVSGIFGSSAAKSAANVQAGAANTASKNQLAMFEEIRKSLAPFIMAGTTALSPLQALTGTAPGTDPMTSYLTRPFAPTEENIASTPGYQFTLKQGLQAAQNANASMGLGRSGTAIGDATKYATGLADATYGERFQQDLASRQTMASLLQNLVSGGANAAANTGTFGTAATTSANNFLTSGAAAQAGGIVGSANAITGAFGGATNNALLGAILANQNPNSNAGYPPAATNTNW